MTVHPHRSAAARTTDLLNVVDAYARDGLALVPADHLMTRGELLALRHLVEALDRVVRNSPLAAEFLEVYAARAVEALELEEEA
jgi:hypothetical protein